MNKAEISISIMVYIVIGLIVLLVVIAILLNKTGDWNTGTSCEGQGGECKPVCGPEQSKMGKGILGCADVEYCCYPKGVI